MLVALADHASIALNDAKAVDQMRHLAYHDALTGLPNRLLFFEHLAHAVANVGRSGAGLAVLYLDVDRFKLVNDSLGHTADLAMYRAKLDGVGKHIFYEPGMHEVASDRANLEGSLRRAVDRSQFEVHYQPIVWLASGEAIGVEALVRWRQEDGTLVSPAEFIPIAEEMGLIVPIGKMVMHASMLQVREWQQQHPGAGGLNLSINLSARQLYQPDVVADVMEALEATDFDPARLTLELTETALMHDTTTMSARVRDLRALGIRIALDDFGTGYSSLSYLRTFPIDVLKVDKSFIDDIACGSEKANLARAIIQLGRTMNLDIVAEGIEDPGQVTELLRLHCRLGQGFHFARPLSAQELGGYLQSHRGVDASKPTVIAV